MTARSPLLVLALALTVCACDNAAPRTPKVAPVPTPAVGPETPMEAIVATGAHQRPGPIAWNPATNAFEAGGQPLRAEKVWTFDGATDGFTVVSADTAPAQGSGLAVRETGLGTIVRTPSGLNVEGRTRSLVLVRLTRIQPAAPFDATVYYSTRAHGEAQTFFARPVVGSDPAVNETVVLVYDMHRLRVGGDDWKNSIIDQVRFDLDAAPGGAFVIHQVAIAQDPGVVLPPPPRGAEPLVKPAPPKADAAKTPAKS